MLRDSAVNLCSENMTNFQNNEKCLKNNIPKKKRVMQLCSSKRNLCKSHCCCCHTTPVYFHINPYRVKCDKTDKTLYRFIFTQTNKSIETASFLLTLVESTDPEPIFTQCATHLKKKVESLKSECIYYVSEAYCLSTMSKINQFWILNFLQLP